MHNIFQSQNGNILFAQKKYVWGSYVFLGGIKRKYISKEVTWTVQLITLLCNIL
jgi:hypothetical protein